MSGNLLNSSAVMAFFAIPRTVIWSYLAFGLALAIGLVTIFFRGDWQKARGLDKLILFGPLFYAAPLAAFGTEHFTLTKAIASIVPRWIPWHLFWAYFVGACFIAAALSLVTKIQTRLSASLLALTFFLFVVLMDAPGWQFMHADHVPGVPLEPLTPQWIFGHAVWTYLAAVVYAVAGVLLLVGKKTRAAATWIGLTVLFLELVVYVPIAVVQRARRATGG